jgi:hypothetical protein
MLSATGVVGQSGTMTITPIPANGTIDAGSGAFSVDVPGVVTLTPSADGLSCVIAATTPGICNITWNGTSLGNAISGDNALQCTVTAAPPPVATAGHVTFGGFA